jgi:hypothetical protein
MKTHEHSLLVAVVAGLALALIACGGPGVVTTPAGPDPAVSGTDAPATLSEQEQARNGPTSGAPSVPAVGTGDLTLEVLAESLTEAILAEYFAQTTYERVLADFGPVAPFSNVAPAEATHVDAVAALFAKRGLTVPPNPYLVDQQSRFADLVDACKAAVSIEEGIYGTYTDLAAIKGLPDDVAKVFAQMMEVTLDHHLPAFQQCAAW